MSYVWKRRPIEHRRSRDKLKSAVDTPERATTSVIHPFQAVSVLGSMLAAVFPRVLNVGFPAIPGEPSRSTPNHAFSGRKNDSLKGMRPSSCEEKTTMATAPLRVLVIGGDGASTSTVFNVLHRSGHQVDRACNVASAISVDLSEYTAIIIDEDWFEGTPDRIVAELRRRAPGAGAVIIASSKHDDQALGSPFDVADDWLTQPVTANQVRLSIARVVKLQQMKQSMRDVDRLAVLGRMVAFLAHEGRNILSTSSLNAELLEFNLNGCPSLVKLTALLRSSHAHLARLFDDVCGYAGTVKVNLEPCNLRERLLSVCKDLKRTDLSNRIEVVEHFGESDLCCQADPFRMDQVYRNLVQNSLAVCPAPVRLTARWSAAELEGHPALRLSLRDNGPGFSDEQRQRAFEPFVTTKSESTGLGLAIAKQIVEAHGGRIELCASDSTGAEFVITVPRGNAPSKAQPITSGEHHGHELLCV
jgi:signal transduction histidine kinase